MRENWDEFIANRLETIQDSFRASPEFQLRQTININLDEMMETNLTNDQKAMVEEVLFAKATMSEQDEERQYQQGMKDAIWLLKKLGVFGLEV